ncbi:MAG TPA: serine hydrolase domain-containing protein, partial [Catenuloplanes sp.]
MTVFIATAVAAGALTATASSATASPATAGELRRPPCVTTPTAPTTLPALPAGLLSAALDTLPDKDVSAALVQIRGSAGCWQGTGGTGDVRTGRAPARNARFRVGSITKVFTAVVALQLVAEGRLDLDRPVQEYLPGVLPAHYPRISVRQVLTFTSGINGVGVPHKDPTWFFAHRYDHWAPGSQLDWSRPLAFAPGTKQRYGNADYWVAGLLIEKVTGHRWDREITERIIRPLGLRGTSAPVDTPGIPGPHAHGYEEVNGHWVDVTRANPSLQWSAAAIVSTADDLDRLFVALFSGRLVPAAQLELMFTIPRLPATDGTGPGREVPAYDGDDDAANDVPGDY